MGYKDKTGRMLIEYMIGPGAAASHRRASFQPDAEWQWSEMARLYDEHYGNVWFLGDWHTHPNAIDGDLSSVDIQAIKEILADPKTGVRSIISVILYGERSTWNWAAWWACRRTANYKDLTVHKCCILSV